MVGTEQLARAQYASDTARRTAWIYQRTDGQWEAIDWHGTVLYSSKYRIDVEQGVKQLANDAINNIHAIAVVTPPSRRRKKFYKPARRSL